MPANHRLSAHKGADIDIRDVNGSTPLLAAVAERRLNVAKLLVEKGANLNAKARIGNIDATPLHGAIMGGYPPAVRFLIEAGADLNITTHDEMGRAVTTLQLAIDCGNNEIVKLIKKAGETPPPPREQTKLPI